MATLGSSGISGKVATRRVLGPLKPLTCAETADVFRLCGEALAPVSIAF
jgi:hypothetical protein